MSRMKKSKRCLTIEHYEQRSLMSADTVAFFGYGALSASLVPDGAIIGARTNQLHASFDQIFGADAWEPIIKDALQTWAREADINVAFVSDDGSPAGAFGPASGDPRFGDIRVFAAPLGTDVWAEAVSEGAASAGTWAGDIIFNTQAQWRSALDLYTVALHEFGHVFGLDHNDNPNSPMYVHGPSSNAVPTAQDLELLRQLHGPRPIDANESNKRNDTIGDALRIKGNEAAEAAAEDFNGSQVWIQFGDLHDAVDKDYYELHVAAGYEGPLLVRVGSTETSLSRLHVSLLDEAEHVLASSSTSAQACGSATISLAKVSGPQKLYVKVEADGQEKWAQGHYALTVGSPEKLASEQHEISEYTRKVHRWFYDSRGAKRGFSYQLRELGGDGYSADDKQTDDDPSHAQRLLPAIVGSTRTVVTSVGSIDNSADQDAYRFRTPKEMLQGSQMLVSVQALDAGTLVPQASLLDSRGRELAVELRSVGFGLFQFSLSEVAADTEYVVVVEQAGEEPLHAEGNYSLVVELGTLIDPPLNFMEGELGSQQARIEQTLYVALPQILTFSLEGKGAGNDPSDQLLFRLFDRDRRLITSTVAPVNSMRSIPGVLVDAGEYYLQVSLLSSSSILPNVDMRLTGSSPSRPIGPLIAPLDSEPLYQCDEGDGFCYPNGTQSPEPIAVAPTIPIALPVPPPVPFPPPSDEFFWTELVLPTNPVDPLDVSGDANVTPLDALLVINHLNKFGAGPYPASFVGYLDTSGDRSVTALDVLLVINQLNRTVF